MGAKQTGLGVLIIVLLCSATLLVVSPENEPQAADSVIFNEVDPLYQ